MLTLKDSQYYIQESVGLLDLVDKYQAPLYVYDASVIHAQYTRLASAFDVQDLQINYACKALTNINILKLIKNLGAGLDTVSIQEVRLGLKAGFDPQRILYTPNGVSIEEIEMAKSLGVRINIDNLSVLEEFGALYPDYPVGVRINPHIIAGGNSKISTGHIDSKFGISFHQFPHILRIMEATGMRIDGLHMHSGSDILDGEVFLRGAEILFQLATKLPDLRYLNFGSGFKVPYKENDIETDVVELGTKISERFNSFCNSHGDQIQLMFEPGKYLVSASGYFLARVNVIKQTTSTVFAGLDTGLNHFIRPMFYDAHHEIINLSNTSQKKRYYTIVGYICESDTFGNNRYIHEISEGDILCFKNAGAYCYMMSSNYNSRYRPAEVLIYEGQAHLIRARESMDDLLRNQIEISQLS